MNDFRNRIVSIRSSPNKDNLDLKIKKAKENGLKEIDSFEKKAKEFCNVLKQTALFDGLSEDFSYTFDTIINSTKNIINGKNNYNLSDTEFLDYRQEYFKKLINKYSDGEN